MNECGSGVVAKSDTTLWDPMDCSLPGSSEHGISRGNRGGLPFPPPGDLPDPGILSLHLLLGRRILHRWATWEASMNAHLNKRQWIHVWSSLAMSDTTFAGNHQHLCGGHLSRRHGDLRFWGSSPTVSTYTETEPKQDPTTQWPNDLRAGNSTGPLGCMSPQGSWVPGRFWREPGEPKADIWLTWAGFNLGKRLKLNCLCSSKQ